MFLFFPDCGRILRVSRPPGFTFLLWFVCVCSLQAVAGSNGATILLSLGGFPMNSVTATVQAFPGPGPAPTGTVSFQLDGNGVTMALTVGTASSTASASFSPFLPGTHVMVVSYSGDSTYAATSASTNFTIPAPSFAGADDFGIFGSSFFVQVF